MIGQKLDNYLIEAKIGQGAMATVYQGRDVVLDRPVAVKVFDSSTTPVDQDTFLREARSVARWQHPHILHVYAASATDEAAFIAMELIDGQDLATYLEQEPLPEHDKVIAIGRAVASALDHAHEQGVIHRDVKPGNILLGDDGRIVLGDFGLVLTADASTLGPVIGTAHYVAPEQARRSADATPQSDIYSLGIVLYEMLTGRVPFDDPALVSVLVQHATQPPPDPRTINPELNEATADVLLRALAKRPEERFDSASELVERLAEALAPHPNTIAGSDSPPADQTIVRGESGLPPIDKTLERGEPQTLVRPKSVSVIVPPTVVAPADDVTLVKPGAARQAAADVPAPPRESRRRLSPYTIGGLAVLLLLCFLITYLAARPGGETAIAEGSPPVETDDQGGFWPFGRDRGEQETSEETELALAPTATVAGEAGVVLQPPDAEEDTAGGDRRLVLFYNENNFYAYNPTAEDIEVRPLEFRAVGDDKRLPGSSWAAFYRAIQPGKCDAIEILGRPNSRPSECRGFNAIRTPQLEQRETFFVPRANVDGFVVLYDGVEIGRCPLNAQRCEVLLP